MTNNFTPEQIEQFLQEFFTVVGRRQYIGARYVPIFGRKDESSIEWDNSAPYEPLTIVLYQGNSYTSRQFVPTGVEIDNQEYWANTGNFNGQVEQYRRDTAEAREAADNAQDSADNAQNDIDTLLPKSAFSTNMTVKDYVDNLSMVIPFDTVSDMQASEKIFSGAVCHTNGFYTSGDGGDAWYVISDSGSANGMDVLSCLNNFYATLVHDGNVNIKQLGASETNSRNNAIIDRAIALATSSITIPYGTFNIDRTIIVNKNIDFVCNGTLHASHSCKPAVLFDNVAGVNIFVSAVEYESKSYDYVENSYNYSVGVVLKNCTNNTVKIELLKYCTTGFILYGSNSWGCHYNVITASILDNCFNGCMFICGDNTGWVNGNTINGMTEQHHSWNVTSVTSYMISMLSFASGGATPYTCNGNKLYGLNFEYGVTSGNNAKLLNITYQSMTEINFDRIETSVPSMLEPFDIDVNTCMGLLVNLMTILGRDMSFPNQGYNKNYVYANEQKANLTHANLNEIDILNDLVFHQNVKLRETASIDKTGFSCAYIDFKNKRVFLNLQLQTTGQVQVNEAIVSNIKSNNITSLIGWETRIIVPVTVIYGTGSDGGYVSTIICDADRWSNSITTREAIEANRTLSINIEFPLNNFGG